MIFFLSVGVNDDRGSTFLKRYPNLSSELDDLNLTGKKGKRHKSQKQTRIGNPNWFFFFFFFGT